MALVAFARRILVHDNYPSADFAAVVMTETTWYALVRALERKGRPSLVIEPGHRPTAGSMTTSAVHNPQPLELASMNILVAPLALV